MTDPEFFQIVLESHLPVESFHAGRAEFSRLLLPAEGKRYRELLKQHYALPPITKRQREILILAAHGLGNKEIAARLRLSAHTVKNHFINLEKRLGTCDRTGAVVIAAQRNLISI